MLWLDRMMILLIFIIVSVHKNIGEYPELMTITAACALVYLVRLSWEATKHG